jgi:hypothetical protein
MAQEAELRIKHDSVEKTTSAIDALISKLDQLDKGLGKLSTENKAQEASQTKLNTALKAAEIARKKAVDMLGLHQQGLHKLSDAYATEQAAIKAREVAAKKGIETGSKEYDILLNNIKATELATTASKRLAAEQAQKAAEMTKSQKAAELEALAQGKQTAAEKAQEKALASSNIARETATKLLKLEEKGLDRLSDEYAEARGEILGIEKAKQKGLKTGSDEYNQIVKNTKAIEQSTAARKRLQKETTEGTKGASKFTDGLDDMAKQAALVDGPLGGIASRLTTLSAILKTTGGIKGAIALTGLGIGVALFTQQLSRGITTAKESEVAFKTLEAQIEATGNAAGYSATQLDMMARNIARGTLDSTDNVRTSIQSLLSFTNVSSAVFEDVIRKSQDIAIVAGKSTKEVVNQLGRVLDNPISKLESLKELRIDLEKGDKDRIKSLQVEGRLYEAQEIILSRINERYGDIARAQADTLAGDLDTVNQQWTELFETLGRGASGPLRTVVQNWSQWLELAQQLSETDVETTLRKQRNEMQGLTKTSEDTAKQIALIDQRLEELSKSGDELSLADKVGRLSLEAGTAVEGFLRMQASWIGIGDGIISARELSDRFYTDEQKESISLLRLKEELVEKQKQQNGEYSDYVSLLTDAQQKARDTSEQELEKQKQLTASFLQTGDTASDYYLSVKAGQDALTEATKRELAVSEESLSKIKNVIAGGKENLTVQEKELKIIYENILATSDLTRQRVTYNTVLQKTKSLQAQQDGLEREVELYRATTSGILKNSEAYIQLSASIKTANEIKRMSGEVTSDQAKALYQENVELLKAQRNQAVLNALKASDSNSANVATLNRQIELQKLLSTGVSKTSSEYIYEEERLKALNTIKTNAIALDSEEYTQLLLNAEGIAAKRLELQKYQDLASMGVSFSINGNSQIEGSLSQLADSLPQELSKIQDMVITADEELKGKVGISQETADKLKESIEEKFAEERNDLLIPLGFFVDEEKNIQAATELNLLQEELRSKEKELKDLWKEEDLISEEQYLERKRQLNVDYEDRITNAKIAAWEATAEAQTLSRQGEVAGVISSGAKMLSAVAGNSKKLAKISKAAAIFETSTALVQSIAKASAIGWPANIPIIAEAFATGTQLVGQARSLKEPSFAFGGVDIQGAGTGRSDSIKANIARGESVMTAPATARYKDTLERMNAGLPVRQGGGSSISVPTSIVIQGDASERTVGLIEMRLREYEERVQQIAQGVSQQTIQEENEVGGFLNPI